MLAYVVMVGKHLEIGFVRTIVRPSFREKHDIEAIESCENESMC